jgi:Ca2+-binding RTX toxin-like protein
MTIRGKIEALVSAIAGLMLLVAFGGGTAAAAPLCLTPQITVSAEGSVLQGNGCSQTIVATSPAVRKIYGGEGNDVIYANPNVEVIYGGAGADVIYGDLPESETEGEITYEPGVNYEPASAYRRELMGVGRGRGPKATASEVPVVPCKEKTEHNEICYGGSGNQQMFGGEGPDVIFGQRGDDELFGEGGNDSLYGGIGDDHKIDGGPGNDLLAGGYGKDELDGEEGSDLVRGDATTDIIVDTGKTGTDTLSYATGTSPGFHEETPVGVGGFPPDTNEEERGVYVRLDGGLACEGIEEAAGKKYQGCDNSARYGGGSDEVAGNEFENLIGSPFDDVLIGSKFANNINGGGGADVIKGEEGNDTLYGGADGDYIDGGKGSNTINGQSGTNNNCFNTGGSGTNTNCNAAPTNTVNQRNRGLISVGFMATTFPVSQWSELYLLGSNGPDTVNATYSLVGSTGHVVFKATSGAFNTSVEAGSEDCAYKSSTEVDCTLPKPLDAIVMDGLKGNDVLTIAGFPPTTTPVLLGGEDNDVLEGSATTEDVLIDGDGAGEDHLYGYAFDDALVNNEGRDVLEGGNGNDLLVSLGTCEGDVLEGAKSGSDDGEDINNASWAPAATGKGIGGVTADLESETAGNIYGKAPECAVESGTVDHLHHIDDLEGSQHNDKLYGDKHANSLFGHNGEDGLFSRAGEDFIEARDGHKDQVDAGGEVDRCKIDSGLDELNKSEEPAGGCEKLLP